MNRAAHFFRLNGISAAGLCYLVREAQRTALYLMDGRRFDTAIPLKELAAALPPGQFASIQKGVVVALHQIVGITDDGVYTMTDGRRFQGRRRHPAEHKRLRAALHSPTPATPLPPGLLEKCTLLDRLPLAFCVIELVFDQHGHGVDFVFRYCNEQMAVVEGVPLAQMVNRSFYDVFPNGDKKWLVSCADVALNGTQRVMEEFGPIPGQQLRICCYQPAEGFCACLLVPK